MSIEGLIYRENAERLTGTTYNEGYEDGYEQGRADEKRENEQDAYHRGYIDGQAKCSFDNELKIRAEERERIVSLINDFFSNEMNKLETYYDGIDEYYTDTKKVNELLSMNKRLCEIVRGGE